MAHESVASLNAAVKRLAVDQGGTISIDGFYRAVVLELKTWVRSKIDTEEERDALIEATLALADLYVKPRWPGIWPFIRTGIKEFADSTFDSVPELLAASPRIDPDSSIA